MKWGWLHYDHMYKGFYKDCSHVHIFYEFDVKLNLYSLFEFSEDDFNDRITSCIQKYMWGIERKTMYEGENPFRLIDDRKLAKLNQLINADIANWCPSGLIIKNINITHLV